MAVSLKRLINRLEKMYEEYGENVTVKENEGRLVIVSTEGDYQDSINLDD